MAEVKEIARKWDVSTRVGRTKGSIIRDIQVKEGFEPCFGTRDVCDEADCLWRVDCLPKE
ncbi:MAG TPA: hypothetical protein PK425_09030 [Syntrophales bacterium]|nr:hypothetical protein [Syntrophales bacterium]HPX56667.1 hypothetical protein [Syntrophales bacterium]